MGNSDDDVQLNICTEFVPRTPKQPKLNKRQRLYQKRQERRKQYDTVPSTKEERVPSVESNEPVKSLINEPSKKGGPSIKKNKAGSKEENKNEEKYSKKMRVSSIFTKNPEIPHLSGPDVKPVLETVFSEKTFGMMDLHPYMVSNLEEKFGLKTVTTVQQVTIPKILEKIDVLVKSQTGSGKTLSYAIPIVEMLQKAQPKIQRKDGVYVVVIVPTRELALQSYNTFEKLLRPFTWIVPGCIMGGEKRKSEKARLRKGINVLVATPGRLLDHLKHTNSLDTGRTSWLVIDEADRLLDMGFEKEVSQIVKVLDDKNSKRQTVLLSATLSDGVERLSGMTLKDPVRIDITTIEGKSIESDSKTTAKFSITSKGKVVTKEDKPDSFATPESLDHHYALVPSKLRLVTLASFILWKCKYSGKPTKMIIFLATQDSVEFHYQLLDKTINVDEEDEEDDRIVDFYRLHGNMPQKERTKVFNEFTEIPAGVLFCTDVAARGLDLPHVRWIVQYNTPGKATEYIHRVGRTARIGAKGNALLFLTPEESEYMKVLNEYRIKMNEIEIDNILKTLQLHVQDMPRTDKFSGQMPSTIQECGTALQAQFEDFVAENKDIRTLARKAYQSFIRAYATFPSNMKHIFHVKKLHIGHTATSFALQEAPRKIGSIVGNTTSMERSKKRKFKDNMPGPRALNKKLKMDSASEFASGLDKTTLRQINQQPRKKSKKPKAR